MSQPVIFDIAYTPYRLKKGSSQADIDKHAKDRAFFDMSGQDNNIYKYMTAEGKIMGEETQKFTMLEYLQKSTGVFNQNGLLSKQEVKEMKKRAQTGEKNIWHGFISFNKENSEKIDTPEKCIDLIKKTFNEFYKDAGFDKDNIDLMCALHLDKPEHLHIHYVFWERAPKIKNKRAAGYKYRAKGKISKDSILKMTERLNAYTLNDELDKKRDEVIQSFSKSVAFEKAHFKDLAAKTLKELAKELPKDKPWFYASKEMVPFREKIDKAVDFLLSCDNNAYAAHKSFVKEMDKKEEALKGIMGKYYANQVKEEMQTADLFPNHTDFHGVGTIHTIEKLRWDYRRRLGNIVLKKAKYIQDNTYTYDKKFKRKTNDKFLKRNIAISNKIIKGYMQGLFSAVAKMFMPETNNYRNRLQEIEEEMIAKRKEEEQLISSPPPQQNEKYNRYKFGKGD